MKTLMIHQNTYNRIRDGVLAHGDRLRVATMDETGTFRWQPSGEVVEEVQPEIAFGNADIWWRPKARKWLNAVLETPRLEWFQSNAAGIENAVLASLGSKAEVYTTCHVQAEAMAEWALWAALDFFRFGPKHRASQAAHEWRQEDSGEIMSSRWLVVGFGAIGSAVGRRVKALGGHVTGVRRSGGTSPHADAITTKVEARDLAAADVILLCAPHTKETEGMANAAFFAGMKAEAVFLNLGRGALVKEDDLIAALNAGRPAFAGLDVTSVEPLPAESPLWSHRKVMITPHDSARTMGTVLRADALFLENLERFLDGRDLLHVADRAEFAD